MVSTNPPTTSTQRVFRALRNYPVRWILPTVVAAGLSVAAIKQGDPLDPSTMIGAQASSDQYEKILSYLKIGKEEGAEVLIGAARLLECEGIALDGMAAQADVLVEKGRTALFAAIDGRIAAVIGVATVITLVAIDHDSASP